MNIRIHERSNGHGQERSVVDWTSVSGRRERRYLVSKKEAEAEAASLTLQRSQTGNVWLGLTAEQRNEIIGILSEAAAVGRSLKEVWRGFRRYAVPGGAGEVRSQGERIRETLVAKRQAHPRGSCRERLALFFRAFAERACPSTSPVGLRPPSAGDGQGSVEQPA